MPQTCLMKMNLKRNKTFFSYMKDTYTVNNFFNYGYVKLKLPKKLYKKLLKECLNARKNKIKITGISSEGVPKHFYIEKYHDELIDFVHSAHELYEKHFPNLADIKILTSNLPYKYGRPWINLQKQHEFIPCHNHDGIFSYSIWMQIPYDSSKEKYSGNFHFMYLDTLGFLRTEAHTLSKEDEGTLIMFPSKLNHMVYPYYKNNNTRISISGNIMLDSDGKKK